MSMAETILDLLIPPRCAFCGAIMPRRDSGVCAACEKSLPFRPAGQVMRKAGQFDCAVTFYYEGAVRSGIHAMKFRRQRQRARVFVAVGDDDAMGRMAANDRQQRRYSGLRWRLKNGGAE